MDQKAHADKVAALKKIVWVPLQKTVQNTCRDLEEVVDQANEFSYGVHIPIGELYPFKASPKGTLRNDQGATPHIKEA